MVVLISCWVDSAIEGGLNLVSGLFRPSVKKQYKYQKKFLDDQTAAQKELYDYQFENEAEYNDPANYFKRLLNGADQNNLSKAAVIDGGAAGQSGVQHQGMSSSGSGTSYDFAASDIGSKIMQNSLIGAQIRNLDSQSEKNRKESEPGGLIDSERDLKGALAIQAANNAELIREKALSEPVRRGLMKIDSALRQLDVDNYQTITDANVKKVLAEADKAWQDSVYRSKENNFYDQLARQNMAESKARAFWYGSQSLAQKALARKLGTETIGVSLQNRITQKTMDDVVSKANSDAKYAKLRPYLQYLENSRTPSGAATLISQGAHGSLGRLFGYNSGSILDLAVDLIYRTALGEYYE